MKPRVTIRSLPIELISQIVQEVDNDPQLKMPPLPSTRRPDNYDEDDDDDDNDIDGNTPVPPVGFADIMENFARAFERSIGVPQPGEASDDGDDASDGDESIPDLEPIDPVVQPTPADTSAPAPGAATAEPESDEEGWNTHSDGEGSSYYEDSEDEWDNYNEDAFWVSSRTFPDGLPSDPLLPLLFVSRTFLHAARARLWRNISLSNSYQAYLVARSLLSVKHAAWDPSDDQESDGTGGGVCQNHLLKLVRRVHFSGVGDVSLGRGGGQHYLDILNSCTHLEEIHMKPTFLRSASLQLADALQRHHGLKIADLSSSSSVQKPLLMTVARVVELLENHWLNLSELSVTLLTGTGGPKWELQDVLDDYGQCCGRHLWLDEDFGAYRKGLSRLTLSHPNVTSDELALVLKGSEKTLKHFSMAHWTPSLTRMGVSGILLTYGTQLTSLTLDEPEFWDPAIVFKGKARFPLKRKDYKSGDPTSNDKYAIARYPFFLDAVMPYLTQLEAIQWSGRLASTTIFSVFPASLKVVGWSACPEVKPGALAKLLIKQVDRMKVTMQPDGSKLRTPIKTVVSKGLKCITVIHDDLSWKDEDLDALETAVAKRGVCLHLSGGSASNPYLNPMFGPMFGPLQAAMFGGNGDAEDGAGPGPTPGPNTGNGAGATPGPNAPNNANRAGAAATANGHPAGNQRTTTETNNVANAPAAASQNGHAADAPTGATTAGPAAPAPARPGAPSPPTYSEGLYVSPLGLSLLSAFAAATPPPGAGPGPA